MLTSEHSTKHRAQSRRISSCKKKLRFIKKFEPANHQTVRTGASFNYQPVRFFCTQVPEVRTLESMKTRELVAAARMGDNYGAYHKTYEVSDKSTLMALRKLDICIA